MHQEPSAHDSRFSRRDVLRLGMLGAASLGFAGCTDLLASEDAPFIGTALAADAPEWGSLRRRFLLAPDVVYLNNSSIGVPPASVVRAVQEGFRTQAEDPIAAKHALQDRIRDQTLPGLARFFGTATEELTLTRNASVPLHLQATGLQLDPGDEVLVTTQEHPAGRQPWRYRETYHGITVREVFIPSPLPSEEEILGRFDEAVGPRTRAVAFCHVTRGGHLYPVEALCLWARERRLASLVDGAQAVGQFPINLEEIGCDAYAASLHKWMLGPCGTGFLYVRQSARPVFRSLFDPAPSSSAFGVPGTMDFPIRAAVAEAVAFMEGVDIQAVASRCRFLSDHVKARLHGQDGVTLLSGAREQSAPGSTIFEVEGVDAVHAVDRLAEANIHIDEHQRDGHNAIRISTHIYNSTDDIDRAIDHLLTLRPS